MAIFVLQNHTRSSIAVMATILLAFGDLCALCALLTGHASIARSPVKFDGGTRCYVCSVADMLMYLHSHAYRDGVCFPKNFDSQVY